MVDQFQEFGNPDPSPAVTTAGNDRHAGGRDDPGAPRGYADDADWPPGAAGDVTGAGTPRCSNADRDRSMSRPRTSTGRQDDDKTEVGVQLPREPPSLIAGGL